MAREEAIAKRHLAELDVLLVEKTFPPDDDANLETKRADVYHSSIALLNDAERTLQLYESDVWSRRTLANCYYTLGKLWLKLHSTEKAMDAFEQSLKISNEEIFKGSSPGDVRRRLKALLRKVQLFYLRGAVQDARKLIVNYEHDFYRLKLDYPDEKRVDHLISQLEAKE